MFDIEERIKDSEKWLISGINKGYEDKYITNELAELMYWYDARERWDIVEKQRSEQKRFNKLCDKFYNKNRNTNNFEVVFFE